jgi:hypothetical protein
MQIDSFSSWISYWSKITFKGRIARFSIRWRNYWKRIYKSKKPGIDSAQQKSIDLFYALLKSKETNLNHSPESATRIIESDVVWVTMKGNHQDYLINIIDETRTNHAHSHEVHIPKEYGFELAEEFDLELEKRFRALEAVKKRVVVEDIDKLINKVNKL